MDIPTTQDILLFRIMIFAIVLFFGATYMISLFIDYFLCVSNICSDHFRTLSFETWKYYFLEFVQLVVVLFAAEYIFFVVVCLSFFWWSCLEAPLCTTIFMTAEHVFKRNLTLLTQIFNCFLPIIFYRVPPMFLELERIWFGVSTSLIPTFINYGKDFSRYNLHAMVEICKEGWIWDFLIKFSFELFNNLTSGTFG